ncbi:MAG: NAD(P)-binding protein [Myxococcaceae bacterium]|nr:NAD(P)-binding protein [Myxococcaceae bacterium]
MRRKFGVVGSGIVGLCMAHGLRKRGHDVTLYSDRTAEQWLNESTPTGGAGRFRDAIALERELGLSHWDDQVPRVGGVHLTMSLSAKNRVLTSTATIEGPGMAVDMRLQIHRWLADLEERGGKVVVGAVGVERLAAIARENDLTFVAVGRGPLCNLFPRDEARSVRTAPPRHLAMAIVKGVSMEVPGVPFLPVKFNISPEEGEAFWMPYLHKSGIATSALLVEARPGKGLDRFGGCRDGDEVVARMKALITERFPWEAAWVKNAELADPRGWLVGEVLPSVRGPVATLPTGETVLALGDTAVSMDPCAGQGANNGAKMVRSYLKSIDARGDAAFDAAWQREAFETFFRDEGERTYTFSDVLTQPMAKAGQNLLIAQYGSTGSGTSKEQKLANAIAENFVDPRRITHCFTDLAASNAFIEKTVGGSAKWHLFKKTLAIGQQQLRQAVGLQPRHP